MEDFRENPTSGTPEQPTGDTQIPPAEASAQPEMPPAAAPEPVSLAKEAPPVPEQPVQTPAPQEQSIPPHSNIPRQATMPQQGYIPPQPPPAQPQGWNGYNGIPQQNGYNSMPQNSYNSMPQNGFNNTPQNSYNDAPMPFRYEPQPGDYRMPPPMSFAPQYEYNVPPVPKETVHPMNKSIYRAAIVIGVLVFLLCVYCIGSDILHGALGSGDAARPVKVELVTQEKPELDPNDANVTADGEYTVQGVAELVKPSIVEVYCYSSTTRSDRYLEGTGSGIIISEDGYIVTNAHVVDGEAFSVILDDEREFEAALIGSDHKTDLAVLKISAGGLTPAVLGNSDETYVGENVVAIGNPAGLTNTVTKGIVSAMNRQVRAENNAFNMDCIQTDAAISPGNSGGALVNMYGQVIGITSSKYASSYSGAYEGLGFAIAINQALPVITDLMEEGYVTGRFRIGITFVEMDTGYMDESFEEQYGMDVPADLFEGLWISAVSEDCDIANSELQADDFILEIEGQKVSSYDDVLGVLDGYKGGDTVTAHCARVENGKVRYFDIVFQLEEDTSGDY